MISNTFHDCQSREDSIDLNDLAQLLQEDRSCFYSSAAFKEFDDKASYRFNKFSLLPSGSKVVSAKKRKLNKRCDSEAAHPIKNKKRIGVGPCCIVCGNETENCIKPWINCTRCKQRVNIYCSLMIKTCSIYTETEFECIVCRMDFVTQHEKYQMKQRKYRKNKEKYKLIFVLYVASKDLCLMKWIKADQVQSCSHDLSMRGMVRFCWRSKEELTQNQNWKFVTMRRMFLPVNESQLHSLVKRKVPLTQKQICKIISKSPAPKIVTCDTSNIIQPKINRLCFPLNDEYFGVSIIDQIFSAKEMEWITMCMVERSNVNINDDIVQQHPEAFDFKQTERTDRVKVYHEVGYTYGSTQAKQEMPQNIGKQLLIRTDDKNYDCEEEKKQNVLYPTSLRMSSLKCSEFVIKRIQTVLIESGLYKKGEFEPDQLQINRYGKHTGIETHFDEVSWFDFPIITLRLENKSALHFGMRQRALRNKSLRIPLRIGTVLVMDSWAAMKYRHCVRGKEHQFGYSTTAIIRKIKRNALRPCPKYILTRYKKKSTNSYLDIHTDSSDIDGSALSSECPFLL